MGLVYRLIQKVEKYLQETREQSSSSYNRRTIIGSSSKLVIDAG
jgi:hypothetical protein